MTRKLYTRKVELIPAKFSKNKAKSGIARNFPPSKFSTRTVDLYTLLEIKLLYNYHNVDKYYQEFYEYYTNHNHNHNLYVVIVEEFYSIGTV